MSRKQTFVNVAPLDHDVVIRDEVIDGVHVIQVAGSDVLRVTIGKDRCTDRVPVLYFRGDRDEVADVLEQCARVIRSTI